MMLRARRITPAGWMRVSRERRCSDISVPSNPTMRSWPICLWRSEVILVAIRDRARFLKKYLAPLGVVWFSGYPGLAPWAVFLCRFAAISDKRSTSNAWQGTSLHLLFQLCQQIQRLQRRQPVQIHLAQFFQHGLRQWREDRQLRRHRFGARRQVSRDLLLCTLMFSQNLARPLDHFMRQARQLGDFDSVAAVCRAWFDFAQKDDSTTGLFYRNVIILHT